LLAMFFLTTDIQKGFLSGRGCVLIRLLPLQVADRQHKVVNS
jgi:hypothetical protein